MAWILRSVKTTCVAVAAGVCGWKGKELMDGAKPTSMLARASRTWSHWFPSEGDAEDRIRKLETDNKKLAAAVEQLRRRLDAAAPSYHHEFPPLPPPPQQQQQQRRP